MQGKKAATTLLVIALIFISHSPSPTQAWDPFGIGKSFRKEAEKAGEFLIGKAKDAFNEAMDHLFDDKIQPMIEEINTLMEARIEQVHEDVDEIIDRTNAAIKDMVHDAADTATKFVDHTVDEIKEKIIDETADQVRGLEEQFFRDANQLLDRVFELVSKLDCSLEGTAAQIKQDIYRVMAEPIPIAWEKCRKKLKLGIRTLASLSDGELYKLQSCRLQKKLSDKSSIDDLLLAYADCQSLAADMRCVTRGSPASTDYYTREWVTYGIKYDTWKQFRSGSNSNEDEALEVEEDVYVIEDTVTEPSMTPAGAAPANDKCGTPLECYEEAVRMMQRATDKINEFTKDVQVDLVPHGAIVMWSGAADQVPTGWKLCDGQNGTPDLRNTFVIGAGGDYEVAATGGAVKYQTSSAGEHGHTVTVAAHALTEAEMPSHSHQQGNHNEGGDSFNAYGSSPPTAGWRAEHHNDRYVLPNTGPSGGGAPHSHDGSTVADAPGHVHQVETLPPYFALAYIMRISA